MLPNVRDGVLSSLSNLIVFADIPVADLANITSRFTKAPYITQEVIYSYGEAITPNMYVGIGTSRFNCAEGDVNDCISQVTCKSMFLLKW